jgi:hypothetical protein
MAVEDSIYDPVSYVHFREPLDRMHVITPLDVAGDVEAKISSWPMAGE